MRSTQVVLFLILIAEIWCGHVYQQSDHREPDDWRISGHSSKVGDSNAEVENWEILDRANNLNPLDKSFKLREQERRNWHINGHGNNQNSNHHVPSKLIEEVPNVRDILHLTQSSLAAISPSRVSSFLDQLCNSPSAHTILNRKFGPVPRNFHIDLIHGSVNRSVPIDSLDKLIANQDFKNNKNVTVFVTGWSSWTSHRQNVIYVMANAYRCRNRHNFLVIDIGDFVNTIEDWLTFDIETVGNVIGESLAQHISTVPPYRYHLIGHGLGAHVAGAAARRFNDITGQQIPRVTGLDPARRCGNGKDESWIGLNRGDAEFVDVIHTNNDILGQSNPVGDADFYTNGAISIQPGYPDVVASHASSVDFYAETVTPGLEDSYLAVKGTSLGSVLNQGENVEKVPMGYGVPVTAKGTYFLETNAEAPHGKDVNYNSEIKCNLY